MPDNRIEPTTVANAAEDARLASIAPASPTGTPLVPARFVPWLMLVAGLASIPMQLMAIGIVLPPLVNGIALAVGVSAGLLLGASPGLRKHP